MHYRRMYDDSEMLYAYDLEGARGRDIVVEIEKVWGGELTGQKGRKAKKPFIQFKGREKKLALNKTNGKAIARMYGPDTDQWPGKLVALYVTTTEFDGEEVECIRIRNKIPTPTQDQRGRGSNGRSNGPRQGSAERGEAGPQLQGAIRDQMEAAGAARPDAVDDTSEPGASHE